MLIVDIVLCVILVVALIAGIQRGLMASLGVLLGLVAGAFAAFWLMPIVNDAWPWQPWRTVAVVGAGLLLLVVGASIGGAIGSVLRRGVDRIKLRWLDRALGGVASVIVGALALSLVGSSVAATGTPYISSALASSRVLGMIDEVTPTPIAAGMAQLRATVLDEAIPQLGELLDLDVQPTAPPVSLDDPELAEAAASVARVSGVAFACGRSSTGSGFVIAADRIVTNAHVVAGVTTPVIELPGRAAREGTIVYFDPIVDLAVIAVPDLGVAPIPIAQPMAPGTAGAVQGYPFGGPFATVNAEVLSVGTVPVPDIYSESEALRGVYALAATIHPGNSGGPLLTAAGDAAGVVFARAEDDTDRGYAMTTAELVPVVDRSVGLSSAVSSGRCTS